MKVSALPAATTVNPTDELLLVQSGASKRADSSLIAAGGSVASVFGRSGTVVSAASDYDAIQVDVTPAGRITSTTVQDALEELDDLSAPVDLIDLAVTTTTLTYDVALHRNRILRFTHASGCTVSINTGALAAGCQTLFYRESGTVTFDGTATGTSATPYTGSSISSPDRLGALVGLGVSAYVVGGAFS